MTNFFKPVTETQTPQPQCARASVNASKMFDSRKIHGVSNTIPKRKWPFPTNNFKKTTSAIHSSTPSYSMQSSGIRKPPWEQNASSGAGKKNIQSIQSTSKRSFIPPRKDFAAKKSTTLNALSSKPSSSKASCSNVSSSYSTSFPSSSFNDKSSKASESKRTSNRNSKSKEKYMLLDNCEDEEEDDDYEMNSESDAEDV